MRTGTRSGRKYLIQSTTVVVPNTKHPGGWNGRFVVLHGTCTQGDGGCDNAIGRVYGTQAVGREQLQFNVWLEEGKLNSSQRIAYENGDFVLMPFALGTEGVPTHFEITFKTDQPPTSNTKGSIMEGLAVTEKQILKNAMTSNSKPEPLVVQSLEDTLKEKLAKEKATLSEQKHPTPNKKTEPEGLETPDLVKALRLREGLDG